MFITFFSFFSFYCLFILFSPWHLSEYPSGVEITIHNGMVPDVIADLMEQKSIIKNKRKFIFAVTLLGVSRKLQAGRYRFSGSLTNFKILYRLSNGEVIKEQITFHEGIRASKIAGLINERLGIDSTYFVSLVHNKRLCQNKGIEASSFEGYLYPDTYFFNPNTSSKEIINKMLSTFNNIFSDSLKERIKQIDLSLHQVITLASIVEGEAVLDCERPIIASLYLNRLKRRMLLQADPTIQYIINNGPRRLMAKDLKIKSPYNTYLHPGLPPGPVNNPGIASILAVLYPDSSNYLFMVANGDGSHTFSRTINEHIIAKRRFDKIRRQLNKRR
jgi:UPF0755 protein